LEPIGRQFDSLLEKLAKLSADPAREPAAAFKEKLETIAPPNRRPSAPLSFDALTKTRRLFTTLQDADEPPRASVQTAVAELEKAAPDAIARWQVIIDHDLPALNQKLQAADQPTPEFTPR